MEPTSTLYKAAASGDIAALNKMLDQKIDVLARVFHRGNTALHISAFYGRKDFVERLLLLVKEQSDEEATNAERRHSFLRALNKEENSALHEAVKGGDHVQIVEDLIKADAALAGICNRKGESALFTAAVNGRLDAVKKLLETTDPVYYARSDDQTCLHLALFYQKYEVAAELIEKAPELCQRADNSKDTPLHIAASRGCEKSIVEKLLKHPSLSFAQNKKEQTALHIAARHGQRHIVECILNSAQDSLEIRDENGRTALHYAVENAQVAVVRYLVRFARVINVSDNIGCTALDIANQKYEEESLSPFFAIRWVLSRKEAIEGVEAANQTRETRKPFAREEKYSTTINSLSVCAVLIATVTFQAAFTLPPHEKANHVPSTNHSRLNFESFVLLDWLAFCFSMVAANLLAYATFLRRHRSIAIAVSGAILPLALYVMMFSFSLGICVQLREDYYELATFFYYAMFFLAPPIFILMLLVFFNALGFRILEYLPFQLPGQGL